MPIVVASINGAAIKLTGQLRSQIGIKTIGEKIRIDLIRGGELKSVTLEVGNPQQLASVSEKLHALLEGARFENNPDGAGVIVAALAPNSAAS